MAMDSSPDRPLSPQAGSKRRLDTDEEEDLTDDDDGDILAIKAPKIQKKSSRPKAGDYDEFGKDMVLTAANRYRALLASQGAFPNPSTELSLIKKAWKLVNAESGVKALTLSPSIITIVSDTFYFLFFLINIVSVSRLKVEGRSSVARRKRKRHLLLKRSMVLIVDEANGP